MAALRWRDLNASTGTLTLRGKTGAREFPFGGDVLEELRAWPRRPNHLQLLGVKHNTAVGQLRARHLPRAFAASGVTPFTPHGLRRGGVDALLRAGVDFGTAASLLGHSPKAMLDFYRQATADDRRRAVAAAALGRLEPLGRKVIAFPGSGDSSVD